MTGASTKHVFHAFSAYVAQLTGQASCKFWPDHPSTFKWDIGAAFDVDLAKTPSAARRGDIGWEDVQVDDHTVHGGLTTIGPLFPGGGVIGGVWLHEDYMKRIGLDPKLKPKHAHDHELRCVVYNRDPQYQDRRFQGFHARVIGSPVTSGAQQLHRLQVWDAGHGMAGLHAPMWWIDVADAADMTESQVGSRAATAEGSLYLDTSKRSTLLAGGGHGPKLPPAQGY